MRKWTAEFNDMRQMFGIGVSDPEGFFPRKEIAFAHSGEDADKIVDALNAAEQEREDVRPGDGEPIDMMCYCDRSTVPHIHTAGYWRKAGIS